MIRYCFYALALFLIYMLCLYLYIGVEPSSAGESILACVLISVPLTGMSLILLCLSKE